MPLTRDLAAFVADLRHDDVPGAAWPHVRNGFADTFATLAAGRDDEAATALADAMGLGLPHDPDAAPPGARGESLLLLGRGRASAADAACLNATAAHALDFDDAAQRGHLSVVMVPALLAEGEVLKAGGRRLMTAYAAGYETWAELVRREPDHYHNHSWHPTGVFGPLAVAAACASLRGLDVGRTQHALAIAASGAGGLIANFGSMTKPYHAGRAASAGLLAARLAERGFTATHDVIEHPKGLMKGISAKGRVDLESPCLAGREWRLPVAGVNIKKYPICFAAHRALDALLDLLQEAPVAAEAVERVVVRISRRNRSTLRFAAPSTSLEAKFSVHFAMAAGLVAGRCSLLELEERFVRRADVQALMRRVEVEPEDAEDPARPGEAPEDVVTLHLAGGATRTRRADYVRGGPERPLGPGELYAKFETCLAHGGIAAPPQALFDALMALEDVPEPASLYARLASAGQG